ncbi:hypothetical protein [Thermomonospora echinospora]|nr:hypothetical protein [Thermomonospora echinospora]
MEKAIEKLGRVAQNGAHVISVIPEPVPGFRVRCFLVPPVAA